MAKDPRGTSKQRGYGENHKRLRRRYAPIVNAGKATCAQCGERIQPGTKWHLGHADHPDAHRLGLYRGPEHARCNVAAANYKAARKTKQHPQLAHFFGKAG